MFTRPRGGPASPAAAFSLLAGFCPWRDKGGCGRISFPGWRAALPAAAAAPQAPAKGSRSLLHVYLGRNSAGQDDRTVSSVYFPGQGVPVPSRRAGRPGRGVRADNGEVPRASMRSQAFVAGASCRWVNGAEEIGEGRQKWALKEGVSTGQRDKGQNTHGRRGTDGDGRGKTIRPRARGRGAAPSFSR